jgi:RNA-binding protein
MLTGKQRRYLRSLAHHLSAILHVGKLGLTANVVEQVDLALQAHELVKIAILDTCEQDRHSVAAQLATDTTANLVQVLGRTVVLYRPAKVTPQIVLPR